jgi:hypothetical protein
MFCIDPIYEKGKLTRDNMLCYVFNVYLINVGHRDLKEKISNVSDRRFPLVEKESLTLPDQLSN